MNKLGKFNLLDEPWISVIVDDKGQTKEVSLKELFEKAHKYKGLAGEMKTQDFAMLRLLLVVLHTVFSRFDVDGKKYEYIKLDDRYRQVEKVDEDDEEDYIEDLEETWKNLWKRGQFPDIIGEYLEKQRDRFFLFDEEYPFFQVRKQDVSEDKINNKTGTQTFGKDINRLITESGNKIAMFSPKTGNQKNLLQAAEIARWLIMYHGYTGTAGKTKFVKRINPADKKYEEAYSVSNSKGWLYDIGGIYIKGNNLYETLILNLVLLHPKKDYQLNFQKPCWEYAASDLIDKYLHLELFRPDNLASLYTAWSSAIYIDLGQYDDQNKSCCDFSCFIVKLPEVNHEEMFLEPMTIWKPKDSKKKAENEKTTPIKHKSNESLWRSFGLLSLNYGSNSDNKTSPGIITWYEKIKACVGERNINLYAVSMKDDGNATSWVPVDEVFDELELDNYVFFDVQENGWVSRISDAIEKTKDVISITYRMYIRDINEIRNIESVGFINRQIEEMYFIIDKPFKNWLLSLKPNDDKDEKVNEWYEVLRDNIEKQAKSLLLKGNSRDYTGIVDGKFGIKNIATAYNKFIKNLNVKLPRKGENYG